MSTTERVGYHHGDLRAALVRGAVELLEAGETFSLRAVARRAGVSQTAPYRHFADREALESALAVEGFHELRRDLSADATPAGSADAFASFGVAYVDFALRRPALFRLMFGQPCDDRSDERVLAARELQDLLAESVRSVYPGADVESLATALWATVHGLAFLHLDGKLSPDGGVERTVRSTLAALGLGGPSETTTQERS